MKKLNDKALEDYTKDPKPNKHILDSYLAVKAYHDWLNEIVDMPNTNGQFKRIRFLEYIEEVKE